MIFISSEEADAQVHPWLLKERVEIMRIRRRGMIRSNQSLTGGTSYG